MLYILEKQKAVFSQNSLVRKIRRSGIFESTQKLFFWQCFDWISHFLWPVCAQVVAIFFFQLCALHLRKKNLPFGLFKWWEFGERVEIWRLRTSRNFGIDWLQLNCWIVELFQPLWENACCLTYAKIKFWTVRNAASCCYCHLTEYCCLLEKKHLRLTKGKNQSILLTKYA